jgi:cytidylate kinase
MYRAFTLHLIEKGISPEDTDAVTQLLTETHIKLETNHQDPNQPIRVWLNGKDVSRAVRGPSVSGQVSRISALKVVRQNMVAQQRRMGAAKGVVMDGRDIGTVVFPDAELKVFMTARLEDRVNRRLRELAANGIIASPDEIAYNLQQRDRIDTTRAESPLRQAADAHVLDTSNITIEEQVHQVLTWALEIIEG